MFVSVLCMRSAGPSMSHQNYRIRSMNWLCLTLLYWLKVSAFHEVGGQGMLQSASYSLMVM